MTGDVSHALFPIFFAHVMLRGWNLEAVFIVGDAVRGRSEIGRGREGEWVGARNNAAIGIIPKNVYP